jgi:subtilisin family serine protease
MKQGKYRNKLTTIFLIGIATAFLCSGMVFSFEAPSDKAPNIADFLSAIENNNTADDYYVRDEILVKFRPGVAERQTPSLKKLNKKYKVKKFKQIFPNFKKNQKRLKELKRISKDAKSPDLSLWYKIKLGKGQSVAEAVSGYANDPSVEYTQPNYIMKLYEEPLPAEPYIPDDYYLEDDDNPGHWREGSWGQAYPDLWGLRNIKAIEGWNLFDIDQTGYGFPGEPGEGVVAAVIDTGVDYIHEDLRENIWVNPGEDINGNGRADGENFSDTGNDGLFDYDEEEYDRYENPDPSGDNYDPEENPTGTEGNLIWDEGEPFVDNGLDAAPGTGDTGEGDGIYNAGDYNGLDDDGNGYIDDIRGYDCSDGDNDPMDYHGHGSHCSGSIAAVADNAIGMTGVAYKAKIMPVKFFPNASNEVAAECIRYAALNGADVLSNSWGPAWPIPSNPIVEEAIDDAHALGCESPLQTRMTRYAIFQTSAY